jgi:predicted HNH restriction endonuclease
MKRRKGLRLGSIVESVFEERNLDLIKKKAEALGRLGSLKCQVCEFDFRAAYGDHGGGSSKFTTQSH